jgi:hypothetical protein
MGFKDFKEYGVYWESLGADNYGQARVKQPVEFRCRWELGATLIDSPLANIHNIAGRAFVDREIPVQSIVWRGKLEDLDGELEGLMQVVDYGEVSDVKGLSPRRNILLIRWHGQLPNAV